MHMPKLNNRLPKYCRQSKSSKYAVVYYRGKPHYLGVYGSPESKIAYHRFLAEIQANHTVSPPSGEKNFTICELTAAFLDNLKANADSASYSFYRGIILDFLDKLFGDGTLVDDFTPRRLKTVREEMLKSQRYYRIWLSSLLQLK